ncbi:twin-arginine translocation signal domain-containing protein [bacterium]|nr:twin-arginine translocation signal domain-containing protein [bacterium]
MSEKMKKNNQLSRRDALKVLGAAAGATALANLPKKWNSPELLSGVLPAHAQTSILPTPTPEPACVDYAVTLELLTSGGNLDQLYASPVPDENEWTGLAGSYARWNCQSGCLYIKVFNPTLQPSTGRLTTISHQIPLEFLDGTSRYILINMDTGEYALDGGTPPDGCQWPD